MFKFVRNNILEVLFCGCMAAWVFVAVAGYKLASMTPEQRDKMYDSGPRERPEPGGKFEQYERPAPGEGVLLQRDVPVPTAEDVHLALREAAYASRPAEPQGEEVFRWRISVIEELLCQEREFLAQPEAVYDGFRKFLSREFAIASEDIVRLYAADDPAAAVFEEELETLFFAEYSSWTKEVREESSRGGALWRLRRNAKLAADIRAAERRGALKDAARGAIVDTFLRLDTGTYYSAEDIRVAMRKRGYADEADFATEASEVFWVLGSHAHTAWRGTDAEIHYRRLDANDYRWARLTGRDASHSREWLALQCDGARRFLGGYFMGVSASPYHLPLVQVLAMSWDNAAQSQLARF